MTLNDGDLAHCWARMRRGFSLAQVAAGRDLRAGELDLMLWQWRTRKTDSAVKSAFPDPREPRRLPPEKRWLRDGSWGDAVAPLD